MINLHTGEQTYVSRLRVRGDGLDPLAAQLRLTSLLQTAEVQPAGLSPSNIICIRRLDDPRPRTISLSGRSLSVPPEWQQSVRASIEQLARRAPRPARETVAADAPCVVFADRAELLAALAGDWCEQRAATRWWWRSLFKETMDAAALVKLWRATPEYVPGALEHLARRHKAVAFAGALADDAARVILHSLTRRFALAELQAAVSDAAQTGTRRGHAARVEALRPETFGGVAALEISQLDLTAEAAPDAPWRDFAPEAMSRELELPQQCLLGVGLSLQRVPAAAQSRGFALRAAAWIDALSSARGEDDAAPPGSKPNRTPGTGAPRFDDALAPATLATPRATPESEVVRAPSPIPVHEDRHHSAPELPDASDGSTEFQSVDAFVPAPAVSTHDGSPPGDDGTAQVAESDEGATASVPVESVAPEIEGDGQDARTRGVEPHGARVEESEADAPLLSTSETEATLVAAPLLEAQIETRFGGLFHLVNLALFLELYGDFTAPAARGIALPIWDFVALLGRRMVGERVADDAVWPLLARLAGRGAGQLPGDDFRPPDAWRIDAGWLRTFPARGIWRWSVARGADGHSRVQVVHPAKFLVLDVPLDADGNAAAQLARELEVYAPAFEAISASGTRPLRLRGRTPLARWVERLHLYTRARLRLALGVGEGRRAARLLCERHARVFVTATHVDVVMRLAELPFEVRVAGLDRDPGWIPAAGRIVAFHFE